MSAPKDTKSLLATEATTYNKHKGVPSAKELADARKAVLSHVKQTTASGNVEAIIKMEKDFLQNDLDRYAKATDKEMIGSLKAGLQGIAAIKLKYQIVDDPERYRPINEDNMFPKNRRQGLPLDEAREAFGSHRARLRNYLKVDLEETRKQVIQARIKALSVVEKDYIARQAKTLGVELPASAKKNKTSADKN